MCYMKARRVRGGAGRVPGGAGEVREGAEARVGVRELRQNLSVYLDRVKKGEVLTVTEHGQVVATLQQPTKRPLAGLDRLVAEGRVTRPSRSIRDLPPPAPLPPGTPPLSQILDDLRKDRF